MTTDATVKNYLQVAAIRLRGSEYPTSELAAAIATARGVDVRVKDGGDGTVAIYVQTISGCEALRRLFLTEGYRVATMSQPDDFGHIVVLRDGPPARLRLSGIDDGGAV